MNIIKDRNHDHFWIEDEKLFESYNTIRGMRYRYIADAVGFENCDNCTEKTIQEISKSKSDGKETML